MTKHTPERAEALEIFLKYNKGKSLINHGKSVEAVMRYFAGKNNEDPEKWGIIGLVHDIDYEMYPEEHCQKAKEILEAAAWPDEYVRALMSHGWGEVTDIKPETLLEKTLYAVDELCGLITACALVRPSKSVMDLTVKSVKKKWKVKSFAAGANREIITRGAEMLGCDLPDLMADCIEGMKTVSDEIGL